MKHVEQQSQGVGRKSPRRWRRAPGQRPQWSRVCSAGWDGAEAEGVAAQPRECPGYLRIVLLKWFTLWYMNLPSMDKTR